MVSSAVAEVARICRQTRSAWLAVCALHERAEVLGVHTSVWGGNDDDYDDAESVRTSLENTLLPPGTRPTERTVYDPACAGVAVDGLTSQGIRRGELAHVRKLDTDDIHVTVNGEYAWLIDGLRSSEPLHMAALLPNDIGSQ